MFEHVDWSHGAAHMHERHGITPLVADEALNDPNRVVINPDYNSMSRRSARIIGYAPAVDAVVTVIVLVSDGIEYGVNGWASNAKDRGLYAAEGFEEGGDAR